MSAKPKASTSIKQKKASILWTEAVEAITINDAHWCCMITMMVETIPAHAEIVRLYDEAAEEGSRKAIYPLSFRKMMSSVKSFAKVDEDKVPPAQGIFHHAYKLVARGENFPPWLIARLIKYLIYRTKMEMLTRIKSESDLEREVDENIRSMLGATNAEAQKSTKSAKSSESNQATHVKPNTRLRKRGEERKDRVYIDDAPEDGLQLFVILTGFRDPDLPLELVKAGLPLTCILRIKNPNQSPVIEENPGEDKDEYDRGNNDRANDDVSPNLMEAALNEFWMKLEKSADVRDNLEAYSDVIFRNFCPPKISSRANLEQIKIAKKDLYDRVSYIVYDLHDLKRLHIDYIRCMRLQNVPEEHRRETPTYTNIMNDVPAECSFVSVILQAMLAQVEADLRDEQPLDPQNIKLTTEIDSADFEISKTAEVSLIRERSEFEKYATSSFDTDASDHLNKHDSSVFSHQRIDSIEKSSITNVERAIILECDQLCLKTYHVSLGDNIMTLVNPQPVSLAELAGRSLQDPRISDLWTNRDVLPDEIMERYCNHVRNIARCFRVQTDPKRVQHYLHLRIFDKMIHGQSNGISTLHGDRQALIAEKDAARFTTHSDPFPLPSKTVQDDRTFPSGDNPISNLRHGKSDTIIDYHVSRSEIFEYPKTFIPPKNSRKVFGEFDASLIASNKKLGEAGEDSSYLGEFIDVRLLSSSTLPQAIHECFRSYQSFYSKYVEITDSILLCFGDVDDSSCVKEYAEKRNLRYDDRCLRETFKILTPVCFRNFCEYIVREEKDFIRDIENSRAAKRSLSAGDLTRKLSYHSDISILGSGMTFTDDDFILPNSLKGHARRQNYESTSLEETEMISKKNNSPIVKNKENNKIKENKSFLKKASKDKSLSGMRHGDVKDSSTRVQENVSSSSIRKDGLYEFIGYDLGEFRIQLTCCIETFRSIDGTFVKVATDDWLYGKKYLGIGIDLPACFLKLQSTLGHMENKNMPFHLITEGGIVLAFSKKSIPLKLEAEDSSDPEENQNSLAFEFRASLPSGLLVEPVTDDDDNKNPFYITQKYISKGPECGNVSREICRKFLRNGTVLKFLDGNEIEVLRPNSTVVRCLENGKFSKDFVRGNYGNFDKGFHSSGEDAARVKITRYTAVEYDGRRYEVENDEVSHVYDRSLVRTRTDLEACEKFIRRDDGTQSILNSEGELLVCFPDGTRIITGYVMEDEPLYADWSDDEFERFFSNYHVGNSNQRRNDGESLPSLNNKSHPEFRRSKSRRSVHDHEYEISQSESFVSILMNCRMEHECYATVAYEPIENSCQLSMPEDVEVQIAQGGFQVRVGQSTELLINDRELIFSSEIHEHGRSVSIYNFRERDSSTESINDETLLVTTDSLGKIFEIGLDGNVIRNDGSSSNGFEKNHRLFAINRDFTGYEYIHKSQRAERLRNLKRDERSSSMLISLRPDGIPEYRLFLNSLEPTDYSKKWLQKVTRIRQSNRSWINYSRSTYANPYDWLFPFGRHTNAERGDAGKSNLSNLKNSSKVLTLTILERIAKDGDRFLEELEGAMARCKMLNDTFDEGRCVDNEPSAIDSEKQVEKILEGLALGMEKNIDTLEQLRNLSSRIKKHESNAVYESAKPRKTGSCDSMGVEETQWYEQCLKKRIILPYFENIHGFCFLWITSWVDKALQLVEQ